MAALVPVPNINASLVELSSYAWERSVAVESLIIDSTLILRFYGIYESHYC